MESMADMIHYEEAIISRVDFIEDSIDQSFREHKKLFDALQAIWDNHVDVTNSLNRDIILLKEELQESKKKAMQLNRKHFRLTKQFNLFVSVMLIGLLIVVLVGLL